MLARRRWLGLTAVIIVMVVLFVRLGFWQYHRHEQRRAANALVTGNYARGPVPVRQLLSPDRAPDRSVTWRAVRASGQYDTARTVLIRNKTGDGNAGVDVVVPLRTDEGVTLLVDRGFVARTGSATDRVDLPAPPAGHVDVVAHVTKPDLSRRGTEVTPGSQVSVSHLDTAVVGRWLGQPTYGVVVDLVSEAPAAGAAPVAPSAPEVSMGPHLSYAYQWWFFACFAIGGWVVLLRRDVSDERAAQEIAVDEPTVAGKR